MNQRLNVAILSGGPSTEHKISLLSGKSIYRAIDKSKYEIHVIGVDHDTQWWYYPEGTFLQNENSAAHIALHTDGIRVIPGRENGDVVLKDAKNRIQAKIDLFFPVLHGTYGEDGVVQGVLQSLGAVYTGVGLMASAVGMDKDLAKRIWKEANIPVADDFVYKKHQRTEIDFDKIHERLGLPMFVKPANAGSSVGVSKVTDEATFHSAVDDAFLYDTKILIEEAVIGKEIECAVLGNEDPQASVLGEIIPKATFYSYEAKYLDDKGADMAIPARLGDEISHHIRHLATKAFEAIGCEGLARVDFFLTNEGRIVLNEINTLPGFTSISMYPKLWEASGTTYSALIDKIIDLALQRHTRDKALKKTI